MKLVMLILGLLTPTPHRTETKKWPIKPRVKASLLAADARTRSAYIAYDHAGKTSREELRGD